MSHLSNSILMNHTRLKAEQRSVGEHSPQEDREHAANKIRRLGDQIEMAQYIRGRIGMDRSTVLDMGRIPGYHTRRWPPSALSQGKENDQSEHAARTCVLEPALKRSRKQSPSTVTGKEPFSPLTGSEGGYSYTTEDKGAGPANATESSEHSPVSGDDQESPAYSPVSGDDQDSPESETEQMSQEVTGSSEYSPVSDAEPDVQAEDRPVWSRQRPRQRICVWPKSLRRSQVASRRRS